jgi:hypothetical protein
VGRAQISRLEREYASLLADPTKSTQCQILLGRLGTILDVGASQELWDRSLQRAIQELDSVRSNGRWTWSRGDNLLDESPWI